MREQSTKLEWLEWFYCNCDFGPADGDVRDMLKADFRNETGKSLPAGYEEEE